MNLEQNLAAFDKPPVQGVVSRPLDPTKQRQEITEEAPNTDALEEISNENEGDESAEDLQLELEKSTTESEEEETTESESEDDEEVSAEFNTQFKEAFGMDVNEAKELVSDLQNFRAENALMRDWGVSPTEYDSRITRVREFYNGLPEDGREKFNSPDGAKAIWNHISKNDSSTNAKAPKRARGTLGKSKSRAKQPELIKRSDILRMSDADYRVNYSRISRAYAENRVVDDV